MSNVLVVDLREEHELLSSRLLGNDSKIEILNIPSRSIFANIDYLVAQSAKMPVWLICASGRRSKAVKERYFSNNNEIKSVPVGVQDIEVKENASFGEFPVERVVKQKGSGGLGIQQMIQYAFVAMLLLVGLAVWFVPKKQYAVAIIFLLAIGVGSQAVTKSCLMNRLLPTNDFTPV